MLIGVDYHPSFQQIVFLVEETGRHSNGHQHAGRQNGRRKGDHLRVLPRRRPTATPSIPDAKSNKAFCIKVGTTVTFMSNSNNTGFVIDYGSTNPFDHEGAIIGGSDRPLPSPPSILVATLTPSALARPARSTACAATQTLN
jgi:hypothetical protein